MIFTKGKTYKLVEIRGALVICDRDEKVKGQQAMPLMIGDAGHLLTYLDRYFFEREKGTPVREAHQAALNTAQITIIKPGIDGR